MKKIAKLGSLAVALAMTAELSGLSSVANAATQTKKVAAPINLVMTIWGSQSLDLPTYQLRANLYTKSHPNVHISVKLLQNYDQQVETMIAGGEQVDIMEVAQEAIGFGKQGAVLNLAPYIKASKLNMKQQFIPGYIGTYSYRGAQYAIPERGGFMVMYYNKSMFKKAGLPFPNAKWTWSEFLKDAQKLTIRQGGTTTQWGVALDNWWPKFGSFVHQNGGHMLNANMTASTVNTPATMQALQFYQDLQYKYHVSPNAIDMANMGNGANVDAMFANQQTAMMTTGLWDIQPFKQARVNFGIAPLPLGKAGGGMEAVGTGLAISAKSKYPKVAFDVIKFLTSGPGEKLIVTNKEDIPASREATKLWVKTLPKGVVTPSDWNAMLNEVFSPRIPPTWNNWQNVMYNDLTDFFNGKNTLKANADKLAADAPAVLAGNP